MRVAAGKLETGGAEVGGAEVGAAKVEVDVESAGVALGRGVEVTCVGLANGVMACRVPAMVVEIELAEGMDVTEPPQAVVAKSNAAIAAVNKVWGLDSFIFLLVATVIM